MSRKYSVLRPPAPMLSFRGPPLTLPFDSTRSPTPMVTQVFNRSQGPVVLAPSRLNSSVKATLTINDYHLMSGHLSDRFLRK